MDRINVMIADNESVRANALAKALSLQQDLSVQPPVGKREEIADPASPAADILVLHSSLLKGRNLGRLLRSFHGKAPEMRTIIAYEALPADESLIDDIRQGVRGYLRPQEPPVLVAKAVRAVAAGHIWAERRILEKTISKHILLPETLQVQVPDLQPLTFREMDMLNMVMKGASNREIAEMSNISERTVKTHLYRVYRKLHVKSRAKAIALLSQA